MAKRRTSIDAIIEFTHEGETVQAKVARTEWLGGSEMRYFWATSAGRSIETLGIPAHTVIADV